MGNLANSASLMNSAEWRTWMAAAASFIAAEVYVESSTTPNYVLRRRLAIDVLTVPDLLTARLLTMVSTTAAVVSLGPVPTEAHEGPVLTRVRELWTPLAKSTYPAETQN